MSLIVDWHAHWVPPEVVDFLAARDVEPCVISDGGVRYFLPGNGRRQPLKEEQLDIARRLAEMDREGITRQVLSLAVVLGTFLSHLPADLELALVDANNEGLSRLVRLRGDRFSGLAVLPMAHLAHAPAVLERAVGEQGLLGAILPAQAFADKPTAQRLADVFKVADRLGAHLFIHPGPIPGSPSPAAASDEAAMVRRRAVDFQNELTAAAITFEYTDFLDAFPGAVVHLANLGGTIALLAERIAMTAVRMDLPPELRSGRLRRTTVDTASFAAHGVALAAHVLGEDRVVFGTDSPALPIGPGRAGVEAAALDAGQRARILAGHAFPPLTR